MEDSILCTIKKLLGPSGNYEFFDTDIIIHINTALARLTQLGVGQPCGFRITGEAETWNDFMGDDPRLEPAKTLVYLKAKKVFDPTLSSAVKQAFDEAIAEIEWTLNNDAEDIMQQEEKNQNGV